MLHHIAMWKLKDFAEDRSKNENALLTKEGFEKLFPAIKEIKKLEVGINMDSSHDTKIPMHFLTVPDN